MAAKRKTKAPAMQVPQSLHACNNYIARIGELRRELAVLDVKKDNRIATVKADYEDRATPIKADLKALEKGVQAYCEAHKETLLKGGRRSYKFGNGTVKWRHATAVKIGRGMADAVLESIKASRWYRTHFLRTKHEIDREAMLKHPERAEKLDGVTIAQTESFEIEPVSLALDQEAAD